LKQYSTTPSVHDINNRMKYSAWGDNLFHSCLVLRLRSQIFWRLLRDNINRFIWCEWLLIIWIVAINYLTQSRSFFFNFYETNVKYPLVSLYHSGPEKKTYIGQVQISYKDYSSGTIMRLSYQNVLYDAYELK
jgi:hypothetical protein